VTDPKSKYTDEEIAFIEKALRDRKSAGQIAASFSVEFRGITRNAIIGVIRRNKRLREIGLYFGNKGTGRPGRMRDLVKTGEIRKLFSTANSVPALKQRKPADWTIKGRGQSKPPQAISPHPSPDSRNLPLADLEPGMCRYATNNAYRGERHLFCGHKTELGSSWCPYHENIVFPNGRRAA
jgi:hypothetical protein